MTANIFLVLVFVSRCSEQCPDRLLSVGLLCVFKGLRRPCKNTRAARARALGLHMRRNGPICQGNGRCGRFPGAAGPVRQCGPLGPVFGHRATCFGPASPSYRLWGRWGIKSKTPEFKFGQMPQATAYRGRCEHRKEGGQNALPKDCFRRWSRSGFWRRCPAASAQQPIAIATPPAGSIYNSTAAAIGKVLAEKAGTEDDRAGAGRFQPVSCRSSMPAKCRSASPTSMRPVSASPARAISRAGRPRTSARSPSSIRCATRSSSRRTASTKSSPI